MINTTAGVGSTGKIMSQISNVAEKQGDEIICISGFNSKVENTYKTQNTFTYYFYNIELLLL